MRVFWIVATAVCGALCLGGCGSDAVTPADVPETSQAVPPAGTGPDYSKSSKANQRAVEAADQYVSAIEQDASFGGLTIVPSGLRVNVVGTPSAAVANALAGMRKQVPVTTR